MLLVQEPSRCPLGIVLLNPTSPELNSESERANECNSQTPAHKNDAALTSPRNWSRVD